MSALISAVLPVYNEAEVVDELSDRLAAALDETGCDWEIVYVNDGSSDQSAAKLNARAEADKRVRVVHLSRNFGHQSAVLAGLNAASGDAVVVMDSDLQDDPAAIPRFVAKWREGFEVVYAIRTARKENPLKRALFAGFYRFLNAISRTPMPNDSGNFGLIDRKVCDEVVALADRDRYFPGLRQWVGFKQTGIEVERLERYDDAPRVTNLGLFRLAKTAIFSFSGVPLAVFYLLAAISGIAFVGLAGYVLYSKLVSGEAIPGWASTILVGCFFGSLNSLGIAILGEYVIRIYDQVRGRPLYVVGERVNFEERERVAVPVAVANKASSEDAA